MIEPNSSCKCTLVVAVDSYLRELLHIRPFLLQRYSEVLEQMSERWLAEIGINQLDALDAQWLVRYIATCRDRGVAMNACHDFCRWAQQRRLIEQNPLGSIIG